MNRMLALGAVLWLGATDTPSGLPVGGTPSLCDVHYPSDARVEWECRRLRAGETMEGLFGERWTDVARFNRVDRRHAYPGVHLKVPRRLADVRGFTPMPEAYPGTAAEAKLVLVDLSEQFLGAYEHGRLVLSAPAATGEAGHETPNGEFRITAAHRRHRSSLYTIEGTAVPYPMNHALRFHVSRTGVAFWIHGRDLPGYPASHGCIGLYDEPMQAAVYGYPRDPVLDDARRLYDWVVAPRQGDEGWVRLDAGPRVLIVGRAPGAALQAPDDPTGRDRPGCD